MTHAIGFCDTCLEVHVFPSIEARADWHANHTHDEDDE